MILRPENEKTTIPVVFEVNESRIFASFTKDEKFRRIIRRCGYTWDSTNFVWSISSCMPWAGNIHDRAAEAMSYCLREGFPVSCEHFGVIDKVMSADYEPLHPRWIVLDGVYIGILWFSGDWYIEAMKIPKARATHARYPAPPVIVPVDVWEYIISFAELHDFYFVHEARKRIETARNAFEKALFVKSIPKPQKKQTTFHLIDEELLDE